MISNFSLQDNLFVEFLLPDEDGNSFILGISTLGGDDVRMMFPHCVGETTNERAKPNDDPYTSAAAFDV